MSTQTKPLLSEPSPTSVRSCLGEGPRSSLVSSIKSLESPLLSSNSDHGSVGSNTTISRRKVRFLPLVRAKDTISRHDMTEEEISNCFLQDDDYDNIWKRDRKLLRRAGKYHSSGEPLPFPRPDGCQDIEDDIEKREGGEFVCVRGLLPGLKAYRRKSIEMVLDEQWLQMSEGYYDDEAISEIYSEAASPCKFRAVYLAMEDRIQAGGV